MGLVGGRWERLNHENHKNDNAKLWNNKWHTHLVCFNAEAGWTLWMHLHQIFIITFSASFGSWKPLVLNWITEKLTTAGLWKNEAILLYFYHFFIMQLQLSNAALDWQQWLCLFIPISSETCCPAWLGYLNRNCVCVLNQSRARHLFESCSGLRLEQVLWAVPTLYEDEWINPHHFINMW